MPYYVNDYNAYFRGHEFMNYLNSVTPESRYYGFSQLIPGVGMGGYSWNFMILHKLMVNISNTLVDTVNSNFISLSLPPGLAGGKTHIC